MDGQNYHLMGGSMKECQQCGVEKMEIEGKIDRTTQAWYCEDCWQTYEAAEADKGLKRQLERQNAKKEAEKAANAEENDSEKEEETYHLDASQPNILKKTKRQQFLEGKRDLIIGDRVKVKGKEDEYGRGTVKYVGPIESKVGIFVGIELDNAKGKNDGEAFGKRYFKCQSNHGIFTQKTECEKIPLKDETNIRRGSRVKVIPKNNAEGIVKYVGAVDYAPGLFFGVELQDAVGDHDGTSRNKRYFAAKPSCGVIVSLNDLQKVSTDADKMLDSTEILWETIELGQTQYVPFKGNGVIRYIGNPYKMEKNVENVAAAGENTQNKSWATHKNPSEITVGIELNKPNGNCDGMLDSMRLFQCTNNHGLFTKLDKIILVRSVLCIAVNNLCNYPHCNIEYNTTMNAAYSIAEFNEEITQSIVFNLLDIAMREKNVFKLESAIANAATVGIPPSAPKLAEAKSTLQFLYANPDQQTHAYGPNATVNPNGIPGSILNSGIRNRNTPGNGGGAKAFSGQIALQIGSLKLPEISLVPKEKNPKSLSGRTDSAFFRLVQLFFIVELFAGLFLVFTALYDSVWAGFPLYIVTGVVCFIIALDYLTMFKLAWTRRVMDGMMVLNICAIVLFIQTLASGFGSALQLPGAAFVGVVASKLIFLRAFKRQLIGVRPQVSKKDDKSLQNSVYKGSMNVRMQ